jgi:hypothetical protein
MAALCTTSVCQHAYLGDHPTLKWVDRAVAGSLAIGFTIAAMRRGQVIAATCGVSSMVCYMQSKRVGPGHASMAYHVAVHVLGAAGFVMFILT